MSTTCPEVLYGLATLDTQTSLLAETYLCGMVDMYEALDQPGLRSARWTCLLVLIGPSECRRVEGNRIQQGESSCQDGSGWSTLDCYPMMLLHIYVIDTRVSVEQGGGAWLIHSTVTLCRSWKVSVGAPGWEVCHTSVTSPPRPSLTPGVCSIWCLV